MRTTAFKVQKSDAGQTRLAVRLAVAATEAGEKVIALALEPQGALSAWDGDREAEAFAVDRIDGDELARLPDVQQALAKGGFTLALLDGPGLADTRGSTPLSRPRTCVSGRPGRP